MIMGNPEMQSTPEPQEKERFYILVNKRTGETEIKPVSLPELNPEAASAASPDSSEEDFGKLAREEIGRQSFIRPDGARLHSFTERARNALGLEASEYVLSGPYESEESAQAELEEFGATAIPELIAREEKGYSLADSENDHEERGGEEFERMRS